MTSTNLRQLPDNLVVLSGNHSECDPTNDKSGCVMNLVAWVCGYEEITDTPPCASKVLTRYAIRLNDSIKDDGLRTSIMLPLVNRLAGSKSTDDVELKRMFYLVDKAVRVFAPIVLDAKGFTTQATTLRNLAPIVDRQTANAAAAAAAATAAAAYAAAHAYAAAAYAAAHAYAAAAAAAHAYAAAAAAHAYAAAAYAAAHAYAAAAYAAAAAATEIYSLAAETLEEACNIVN